jgi:ribosome-associated heat shock protein Hsp15
LPSHDDAASIQAVTGATRVRVDKWLWAARFYKTRSAAQQAIEGGKVKLNDERTKPAKEVKEGDRLSVSIGAYEWAITVVQLSDRRGSATIARALYEESQESVAKREAESAKRRGWREPEDERRGRPTKRERRELDRWRGSD